MIYKVILQNFKIYENFEVNLNEGCTILVGDNEAGKSTLLEAINLALTKRMNGRSFDVELTSNIFNCNSLSAYVANLHSGIPAKAPTIVIELYLNDEPSLQFLRGTNNSKHENAVGVRLEAVLDDDFKLEYERFIANPIDVTTIPTEYYRINWLGFSGNAITSRSLPIFASLIDATTIRLQNGADYYLQEIINETLTPKEKVELTIAFRALKEEFFKKDSIKAINAGLQGDQGEVTSKELTIGLDTSHRTTWENSVVPHLDEIPFQFVGKGEQNKLKILLALRRRSVEADIILIEEPENHLSFSSMTQLIDQIKIACDDKQVVIATHSTYVLNKIGLQNLVLLCNQKPLSLQSLSSGTYEFFRKLPGYDTLRLILAKKAILVEGPSDELIIQKAYHKKYGHLPIADGVDVISVGLSFLRFLELAKPLGKIIAVVTDNDGDYENRITKKYQDYLDDSNITICADKDESCNTLEPQIVACNSLSVLNTVLGTTFKSESDLIGYMTANKTDCAIKIFDSIGTVVNFPTYIERAVEAIGGK